MDVKSNDINVEGKNDLMVGFYGETDPWGRDLAWFESEAGKKSMDYYLSIFAKPLYKNQVKSCFDKDPFTGKVNLGEIVTRSMLRREKWPTAFFHYYFDAIRPAYYMEMDPDYFAGGLMLAILLEIPDLLEAYKYFVEHYNKKTRDLQTAWGATNIYESVRFTAQLVLYVKKTYMQYGAEGYKEEWLYSDQTFVNSEGKPYDYTEAAYVATLLAEHGDCLSETIKQLAAECPSWKKNAIDETLS